MNKYIVNLTNYLIGKNHYDEVFNRIRNPEKFLDHIKTDLYADDVRKMSHAKLGEIMCSFDIGDVMASREDLFNGTSFDGNCEEFLRELVSLCLAYAIRDRLDDPVMAGVPPWQGRIPGFQSGCKGIVGGRLAARRRR